MFVLIPPERRTPARLVAVCFTITRRFEWNECLRPPSPFILSPRRGNRLRWFPVLRMSVRPIPSYIFSKARRTILPLLGERAGARADVSSLQPGRDDSARGTAVDAGTRPHAGKTFPRVRRFVPAVNPNTEIFHRRKRREQRVKASLPPERRPPARLVAASFSLTPCWEAGAPLFGSRYFSPLTLFAPVQHQFRGKSTFPVRFHGWNQTPK